MAPQASIAGLEGGKVTKGTLQIQQGVAVEFYTAGSHWENCTIEALPFFFYEAENFC